jgi:hypothetical protein
MALQVDLSSKLGVDFTDVYVVITRLELNYRIGRVTFEVRIYISQAARDEGARDISADKRDLTIAGDDFTTHFSNAALSAVDVTPRTKAYDYLKTLPVFAEAIDV